jgi:hypothetical protein
MTPLVKCEFCDGIGKRELPEKLKASYLIAKKLGTFKVADFQKKSKMELSLCHHHINRLVTLGAIKMIYTGMPATYRVV